MCCSPAQGQGVNCQAWQFHRGGAKPNLGRVHPRLLWRSRAVLLGQASKKELPTEPASRLQASGRQTWSFGLARSASRAWLHHFRGRCWCEAAPHHLMQLAEERGVCAESLARPPRAGLPGPRKVLTASRAHQEIEPGLLSYLQPNITEPMSSTHAGPGPKVQPGTLPKLQPSLRLSL